MKRKRVIGLLGVLLLLALVVTACGGGGNGSDAGTTDGAGTTGGETGGGGETVAATATPAPQDQFPEFIPIHPDAFDFEATVATNTYVYYMPGMVQDAVDYITPALEEHGWAPMSPPTIMGHLATFNMDREEYRMAVSMQDNENSQTTRIQMILNKK